MARKVVNFVKQSPNNKYTFGDLRQLVYKAFQDTKQKEAYQIAEVTDEQYKKLKEGKTLTNADLGFMDLNQAKTAIAENDILASENDSLKEELERLQKQLEEKDKTTSKNASSKSE